MQHENYSQSEISSTISKVELTKGKEGSERGSVDKVEIKEKEDNKEGKKPEHHRRGGRLQ